MTLRLEIIQRPPHIVEIEGDIPPIRRGQTATTQIKLRNNTDTYVTQHVKIQKILGEVKIDPCNGKLYTIDRELDLGNIDIPPRETTPIICRVQLDSDTAIIKIQTQTTKISGVEVQGPNLTEEKTYTIGTGPTPTPTEAKCRIYTDTTTVTQGQKITITVETMLNYPAPRDTDIHIELYYTADTETRKIADLHTTIRKGQTQTETRYRWTVPYLGKQEKKITLTAHVHIPSLGLDTECTTHMTYIYTQTAKRRTTQYIALAAAAAAATALIAIELTRRHE